MAIQPIGQPTAVEPRYEEVPVLAADADARRTWLMNHAAWGAIIAGIVTALLIQLLLSLLGVGVGLTSFQLSGNTATNPSAGTLSIEAGIWWVVSGLIAAFVGGIVAGRLSGSPRHSTAAWHGFVAWCSTTLIIVWLLGTAFGGVLGGTFSAVGGTLAGVGKTAAAAAKPDTLGDEVRSLVNPNDAQTIQNAITTYVRAAVSGDKQAAEAARQKAVNGLARVANISADEAQNRLNQLQQEYQRTAQQAKQAADTARKDAGRGALFAFAALLLGGIFSIVGGGLGTPRRAFRPPVG